MNGGPLASESSTKKMTSVSCCGFFPFLLAQVRCRYIENKSGTHDFGRLHRKIYVNPENGVRRRERKKNEEK